MIWLGIIINLREKRINRVIKSTKQKFEITVYGDNLSYNED